uniref:Peroxisomal 2,4-dienoyl-CoA reductase [(3E)-enoyl-CoA-producing] n=1 Tax=Amphilophus citrinellus TaxID=61819 RepID=A0A3Q0T2U7_AMPCI
MAEPKREAELLPEDVDTDDCLTSYTYIYSPDLLKDRVAFITGGGSGIGLRIAEIFMRHGCDTVIASRNLDKLNEAAKKLSAVSGRRCLPLCIDVRQPDSIMVALEGRLLMLFSPFLCRELATRQKWPTALFSWPAGHLLTQLEPSWSPMAGRG